LKAPSLDYDTLALYTGVNPMEYRYGSHTVYKIQYHFVFVTKYRYQVLCGEVGLKEIVGVYIGKRDSDTAQKLWESLPPVYRQFAVAYTDSWEAYECVLPSHRHKAVGKETGLTNHIERFNNTVRQRVGRLVRKSLSFSKKIENHMGAIWNFIHHYNESLCII
jgi:IS1 family transposase